MPENEFLGLFIREEIYLINPAIPQAPTQQSKHLMVTPAPLTEKDLSFLNKIFAAVNLTGDDLELTTEPTTSLEKYQSAFFFGTLPVGHTPEFYQKSEIDGCTVVVADTLSTIAANQAKKKKLWTVLQTCFNPVLP